MARKKKIEIAPQLDTQPSIDDQTLMATPRKITEKIEAAHQYLSSQILDRHQIIRLLILSVVSQEHMLLIGPPGTGKSFLSKKLKNILDFKDDHEYFERLLTKFSVPEEMFGPLSLKALENDQYIRKSEGYLPTAKLAFVDEIFKANSAILNSLLTILNERLFDQADQRVTVPLLCLIGASNELPKVSIDSEQDDSSNPQINKNLNALFDRFIFRDFLDYIPFRLFDQLLDFNPPQDDFPAQHQLTFEDLIWIKEKSKDVLIHDQVPALLGELRAPLKDMGISTSDRRWLKILNILKVAALCENDQIQQEPSCVHIWHLQLLPWMLWEKEEQIKEIQKMIQAKLEEKFAVFNAFSIAEPVATLEGKIKQKINLYMNQSLSDYRNMLLDAQEISELNAIQQSVDKLQQKIAPYLEVTRSLSFSKDLWIYDRSTENTRNQFLKKHIDINNWHQRIQKIQTQINHIKNIVAMPYMISDFSNDLENSITMVPCYVPEEHQTLKRHFWVSDTMISFYHWTQIAQKSNRLPPVKTSTAFFSNIPIHSFDWFEVIQFCNVLSELHALEPFYIVTGDRVEYRLNANGYRLLHNNEWEYAAYAGESYPYAGSNEINDTVWYQENSNDHIQSIKKKQPNALGLYDMVGNLLCWCNDDVYDMTPTEETQNNFFPINPNLTNKELYSKICRGAHFRSSKQRCEISSAKQIESIKESSHLIGFRIARYFFNP